MKARATPHGHSSNARVPIAPGIKEITQFEVQDLYFSGRAQVFANPETALRFKEKLNLAEQAWLLLPTSSFGSMCRFDPHYGLNDEKRACFIRHAPRAVEIFSELAIKFVKEFYPKDPCAFVSDESRIVWPDGNRRPLTPVPHEIRPTTPEILHNISHRKDARDLTTMCNAIFNVDLHVAMLVDRLLRIDTHGLEWNKIRFTFPEVRNAHAPGIVELHTVESRATAV